MAEAIPQSRGEREPLKPWADDVPLRGPDAPRNTGKLKHLIEYMLTVYERFGDTSVTCSLQWGSSALHKRDAQAERIAELEQKLASLASETKARPRDPDALKKRRQPCTCTGSCRGAEGLGEGWVCGLTLGAGE